MKTTKRHSLQLSCLVGLFLFYLTFPSFANGKNSFVYHIPAHQLDEMEDSNYASFLKRIFETAKKEKPSLIILEIDTPGGEMSATLEIKNILLNSPVPTLCFINKNAISAGSLLALSCQKIVMAKGGVIGAATPVFQDAQEGVKKAPEKIVSATRAAWRSAGEATGRNPSIAEAFVDESIVLTKAKDGVDKPAGRLLTLTTQEALELKIADYSMESVEEIVEKEVPGAKIQEILPNFWDQIFTFLMNPIISGLLLGLGFLALFYEIKIPGWGISGALGLVFLTLFFLPRIMIGLSGWGAPALFAFGILLLFLEVFVIPGFGFAGIMGILSLLGSIFWIYDFTNISEIMTVLSFALLGILIGLFMLFRSLPSIMKRNKNLFLNETLQYEITDKQKNREKYLNKMGVTFTSLRPAGTVQIGNERVDVITSGEYIEKGEKVRVILVEGMKIVVRADSDSISGIN